MHQGALCTRCGVRFRQDHQLCRRCFRETGGERVGSHTNHVSMPRGDWRQYIKPPVAPLDRSVTIGRTEYEVMFDGSIR